MKRKKALRELARMRDAGELCPWMVFGFTFRRAHIEDLDDAIIIAAREGWVVYAPKPHSHIRVWAGSDAGGAEANKAAADAWLAALPFPPPKVTKRQLRERIAELEAAQADAEDLVRDRDAAVAMAQHADADIDELAELRAEVERLKEERDQLELELRPCRYAQALDEISKRG